ncbi:nucleotidyl transferase AbiEii/AbiGii toxin family protein [Pseudonocardia phyllosphaerae]|uniref:nucleotidyl transferase AbiEii/AbiGii toxin family protein n=1 Tax=Pseudonocardia phyllosphaerae TaxID=3390502 RepID=UPI00397A2920
MTPQNEILTLFQIAVAELFFSLPESDGFLIAGGAALAAQHLTNRPTQDLDLFTRAGRSTVTSARDAFENAVTRRGWSVGRIRDGDTFCRLLVSGEEDLLVDLALDSPPALSPVGSVAGPTFAPEELAGRKLLALFGRAEARDFADVFVLAHRYEFGTMLDHAVRIDPGLDRSVLAAMIGSLQRFEDDEIPIDGKLVAELRGFFRRHREELDDS